MPQIQLFDFALAHDLLSTEHAYLGTLKNNPETSNPKVKKPQGTFVVTGL